MSSGKLAVRAFVAKRMLYDTTIIRRRFVFLCSWISTHLRHVIVYLARNILFWSKCPKWPFQLLYVGAPFAHIQRGEKLRSPKNSAHQNHFLELQNPSQFLCYRNQFFTYKVACCFCLSARHGLFLEWYRFKRYHVLSTTKTAFWVYGIPATGTQQLHFQCFCIWFGPSFLVGIWRNKDIFHWME